MSNLTLNKPIPLAGAEIEPAIEMARLAAALRRAFGTAFSFWNSEAGDLMHVSLQQPGSNDPLRGQLARAVVGGEPQFIADEDSVLLLAVPFPLKRGAALVATAAFVVHSVQPDEDLSGPARLLGLEPARTAAWINRQSVWSPDALLRLATAVQGQVAAELRVTQLELEVEKVSDNLASTYEEICLLHSVTQNLRISSDEEQLCSFVVNWLLDCLPAETAAIQLLPLAEEGQPTYRTRTQSQFITSGPCSVGDAQFSGLIKSLNLEAGCSPFVANERHTGAAGWPLADVRQVIIVPLAEKDHLFGWLTVFNHRRGQEFGTVEASLLASVGAMLGIHSGNRELYRQQSEFLASVVRALTSAIDAKDPYTCGHSDRVARVAVRLAKEMGADAKLLHTLYMAGLLHDTGKIGIDDAVLRKPDKLTDAEFDHIKLHPELGYRILCDIQQLADVLPAVLHHHEQWDGRGYPFKLVGEQIPYIARIVAVADAYDAMSSDRPYRKGMDAAKVDEIFRAGAGKQWDAEVVAAFFSAREDIRQIGQHERANLTLDVQQWT